MRSFFLFVVTMTLLCGHRAAVAAPDVVACDLLDEPTVSALIGVKTRAQVNRQKQEFDGALISTCMFRAERQYVMVTLLEYRSATDAAKAYAAARKEAAQAKTIDGVQSQFSVEDESSLGDKAYWYFLAPTQFGLSALKDNKALKVNFQFNDAMTGSNSSVQLKARSRPALQAAARKL
jgi:hypothetical protein